MNALETFALEMHRHDRRVKFIRRSGAFLLGIGWGIALTPWLLALLLAASHAK